MCSNSEVGKLAVVGRAVKRIGLDVNSRNPPWWELRESQIGCLKESFSRFNASEVAAVITHQRSYNSNGIGA